MSSSRGLASTAAVTVLLLPTLVQCWSPFMMPATRQPLLLSTPSSRTRVISQATSKEKEDMPFFATMDTSTTTVENPTSPAATTSKREEVMEEANDALASVGWSAPLMTEEELTSDDPFVKRIDASIQNDFGVSLDELLNPAKVVNLERDLYNLRTNLYTLTNPTTANDTINILDLTTEQCDGGGGGSEADALRQSIAKKEATLMVERRAVFRGWLKNVFLGQAVLSLGLSWIMVTNPVVLFGGFDWFEGLQLDQPIRVLGFWWWWLFIVPSLRSRRPGGLEKKALDLAFLATPAISIVAPVATKDPALIWLANLAVVLGSYGYAFLLAGEEDEDDGGDGGENVPGWLKFVYKSLDFGTGRERGARQ